MMDAVGDQWQGKRGNYTRRLSREVYNTMGLKIPGALVSKIGNYAKEHSSDTSEWAVEFTRDLNLSPEDFCHEDSCWWGSYYESRCALKSWGGLGIRTFENDGYADVPTGRAWVQPLNKDMQPTHNTINAHAYVVFNCYEALSMAKPARIIAHLTGRTYRKIQLNSDAQYINGDSGWLVADEETCQNTDSLYFDHDCHDKYDADQDQEVYA
jgi:hypothetical protein